MSFEWPTPVWLDEIADPADREHAKTRFFLSLAALYAHESGNAKPASQQFGFNGAQIAVARCRGVITADMAIAMERKLGRDLFPRELFRPDLFSIPTEA